MKSILKDLGKSSSSTVYNLNQLELESHDLFVNNNELEYSKKIAKDLIKLDINKVEMQWVQVLSEGWAYPLTGFMREDEYLQTLHFNSLKKNSKIVLFE